MAEKSDSSDIPDEDLALRFRQLTNIDDFSLRPSVRPPARERTAVVKRKKKTKRTGPAEASGGVRTRSRAEKRERTSDTSSSDVTGDDTKKTPRSKASSSSKENGTLTSRDSSSSRENGKMTRYDYPSIAKFCGNVQGTRTEILKWMSYDVHRWLKDSACRITSKKLTAEEDKIRETILGVHPDIGDAAAVCGSELFAAASSNYEEWKKLATKHWLPVRSCDALMAVGQLVGIEFDPLFSKMVVNIEGAQRAIEADIEDNKEIPLAKHADFPEERKEEKLVVLKDILNYLGAGILYGKLSPTGQEVFRDVEYKPTTNLIALSTEFNHLAGKKIPGGIKEARSVHHVREGWQERGDYEEEAGSQEEGEVYFAPQYTQSRGRGHQSYQRGYRGRGSAGRSRGNDRGRGRGRQPTTHSRTHPRCRECGREGHWVSQCPDVVCVKCKTRGHLGYVCPNFKDDRQSKKPFHGKGKRY